MCLSKPTFTLADCCKQSGFTKSLRLIWIWESGLKFHSSAMKAYTKNVILALKSWFRVCSLCQIWSNCKVQPGQWIRSQLCTGQIRSSRHYNVENRNTGVLFRVHLWFKSFPAEAGLRMDHCAQFPGGERQNKRETCSTMEKIRQDETSLGLEH